MSDSRGTKLSGDIDMLADGVDRPLFYAILRKLDFSRELFDRPLETYSAGQKREGGSREVALDEGAGLYLG